MLEGIICLVYSLFAFQEKGTLLTIMYFIANDKEWAKIKTKKEYQFVGKIYLLMSILFAVISIGEIFNFAWILKITLGTEFIIVIYAFTISIKNSIRK